MIPEDKNIEYKSLKKVSGKNAKLSELAETCVCLANSQGGLIIVGIEDKYKAPPAGQTIEQELVNKTISQLRSLTSSVGIADYEILRHENGGEYFQFRVLPSSRTIATTSTGKVFMRVSDNCFPVSGDELTHLAAEKNAFQWELVSSKSVSTSTINPENIKQFADDIRNSDRVKNHVKQLTDIEIIEHYNLSDGNYLTNLGILWLGNALQRSRIAYPITVQYIVYDDYENKIRKESWHDNALNPKALLFDIEQEAKELKYFHEFPDGLFRKRIHHYDPRVIRELLINAIAHKTYTVSGDIFIEVYPDRLEIKNPGKLPLGITRDNILHQQHRRNPHLIRVLHDLKLMEGEGSGYDLIYEIDSRDSKAFPEIIVDFDSTKVIQSSKIIDEEAVYLLDFISQHFQLTQREFIALGVIARHKKILSTQLAIELQLAEEERMRSFTGRLLELNIIISQGVKKGTAYLINPKLISDSKLNIKPTLKTIEPHVLKALIEEDLKHYPESSIRDIHNRLKDVPFEELQRIVYSMVDEGKVKYSGGKTYRKYFNS
jgi:ATP-dependent DNA helicase RecG